MKKKDIVNLIRERKLFLFGEPIGQVVEKSADIKYDYDSHNEIFILEESPRHRDGLEFEYYDLEFFNKYYKNVLKLMRHSISDQDIEKAKENMRKIEFGLIENQFGQAVNHYNKKEQIYEGLKEEANQITNGKTLSKRPN